MVTMIAFPGWREDRLRSLGGLVAALLAVTLWSSAAHARPVEFVSPHPVPHKFGGGFCYIDVPHVHNYPPDDPRMYRETRGQFYFVGDPAPFGYDGPRYSYYGAHPVAEAEVRLGHPVFCYLKGPHYHGYPPPPQAQFQLSGGAYWYVGAFPRTYYDDRPCYAVINEAYAPMPYARPVVEVAVAPPMVRAEISFGGPGWGTHAVVGPPVPAPVLAAPPPGPPVEVGIGVGINVGGPPAVVEYRDERYHHDHGRHEGWGNHPRVEAHHGRPARFIAGPAPVREPLFRHRPGHQPTPRFAPAPHARPAPMGRAPAQPRVQPAPSRSPAPAPSRGRDHRDDSRDHGR
jgi:hypothetical protein